MRCSRVTVSRHNGFVTPAPLALDVTQEQYSTLFCGMSWSMMMSDSIHEATVSVVDDGPPNRVNDKNYSMSHGAGTVSSSLVSAMGSSIGWSPSMPVTGSAAGQSMV